MKSYEYNTEIIKPTTHLWGELTLAKRHANIQTAIESGCDTSLIELLSIPENSRGELRVKDIAKSMNSTYLKAKQFLESFLPTDMLDAITRGVREIKRYKKGSYHDRSRKIMSPKDNVGTLLHELVHALEYQVESLSDWCRSYILQRSQGKLLPQKKIFWRKHSGDKVYDGGWSNVYAGRVYKETSSEILTVGIEGLYKSPVDFAKQDPDYFWWLINTFQYFSVVGVNSREEHIQKPRIGDVIDFFEETWQLAILPQTAISVRESSKELSLIHGIDTKTLDHRWIAAHSKEDLDPKTIRLPLSKADSLERIVKLWPKAYQCNFIIKYERPLLELNVSSKILLEETLFTGVSKGLFGIRSLFNSLHNSHQRKTNLFGALYEKHSYKKSYPLEGLMVEVIFSEDAQKTANDFMKEYIQKTGDKPLFNRVPTKRVPKAWIEIELAERLTDLQNEMAIQ